MAPTPDRRTGATRRRSDWLKVFGVMVGTSLGTAFAAVYAQANIPAAAPEVRAAMPEGVTREEFAELRERVRQVDERTARMETILLNGQR